MAASAVAGQIPVTRRIEEVSGIRPVTLLIASGIALITALVLLTGIALNHLREQALSAAANELTRIDSVLAKASERTLRIVDAQLAETGDAVQDAMNSDSARFRDVATAPETGALLS